MPRQKSPNTDTKFMTAILEKLVEKGLAQGTILLYINKLKKINDDKPFTSFSFLKDTKKIKSKLDEIGNINTKKSYMTAIVSVLNMTDAKQYASANTYYKGLLNDEKYKINEEEMTEKQKENWMTWDEVMEKYKELDDEVKKITDAETAENKKVLTEHLLLALYVLNPPRRNDDYYLMQLDTNKKIDDTHNFYRPATSQFIFNQYKTKKHYGTETIMVNTQLKRVLDKYIKLMGIQDGDFLLFRNNRSKSNIITKTLNNIFGKNIGASMLRHIYLTSKYGAVKDEMKKDAMMMAHSTNEQKNYIKE